MWNFKPNFKCSQLKFLGRPQPSLLCVLAGLSQYVARVKISGTSTSYGPKYSPEKVDLGGSKLTYYFMDSGPKFTRLVSLNSRRIVLDHISFRFWIYCLVPKIFAIKLGSCVKSCQILHVFGPKLFRGASLNFWTCIIKLTQILIMWQNCTAIGRGSSEILLRIKSRSLANAR